MSSLPVIGGLALAAIAALLLYLLRAAYIIVRFLLSGPGGH